MNKLFLTFCILGISLVQLVAQPNWKFVNTGENHTILVHETTKITIDGKLISKGDYISVFYEKKTKDGKIVLENAGGTGKGSGDINDRNGVMWEAKTTATAAWGTKEGQNNGFAKGEKFKWRIYRASDGKTFDAVATYITDHRIPDEGKYKKDGISRLGTLKAVSKK
ncbi:MAG: hypothetical protein HN704_17430 [Bacteroidetes bacterium]|jgi:hypothetical protein|nr:hypothetical protein [Bacteroidota bacterium]MBT6685150.1 hypothetical protein [Bacteroidota bacterium]MBT7142061.1 hypothetical protein [Bacteroidota bacterium]MBT7493383.1 hypothetical protein [Bacteroidota bacterium]